MILLPLYEFLHLGKRLGRKVTKGKENLPDTNPVTGNSLMVSGQNPTFADGPGYLTSDTSPPNHYKHTTNPFYLSNGLKEKNKNKNNNKSQLFVIGKRVRQHKTNQNRRDSKTSVLDRTIDNINLSGSPAQLQPVSPNSNSNVIPTTTDRLILPQTVYPESTGDIEIKSGVKSLSLAKSNIISSDVVTRSSPLNKKSTFSSYFKLPHITTTKMPSAADYEKVAEAVRKIMPNEDYDDGSIGPVLVRLAWHASGTYDKASGTGGSNGSTMRYTVEAKDGANNGLENARRFLEPIKAQFPWISYADLWTLAGATAVESMDGPKIPWKPGRVDYVDESNVPPNGRLPDGALGQDHLRNIFYRMGFNDQEIVALCGAHNLGRCHGDRSGFDGPWVPSPTRFSNTYFKLLLHEEWALSKNKWGVDQYYDEDKELMMLPADYSLIQDPKFKVWVEKYAEDKELFYKDFASAFSKLLELGVRRGADGLAAINFIGKVNEPIAAKL